MRIQTWWKRGLQDLAWVREKRFLMFVMWSGVVDFGLTADGIVALLTAVSGDSLLTPRQAHRMILFFPLLGGILAAMIWLAVYFHLRGGDVER